MTKILKLKEHDSRRETGTIELTDDGFVEFTAEEIGYYSDSAWYRLTEDEKSQLLGMIAPELLAENEALKTRIIELEDNLKRNKNALKDALTGNLDEIIDAAGTYRQWLAWQVGVNLSKMEDE